MEELSVNFQYTKQDIINFVLDSYSFEKVRCTLFLIFNTTAFIIGLVFLFLHKFQLGIFFIGISIVSFPLILYASFMTAQNSLKAITNVVCTLKETSLSYMSNFGENEIEYKNIIDVKITNELIFVYIGKTSSLIIPKRAFKDTLKAIDFAAQLMEKANIKH